MNVQPLVSPLDLFEPYHIEEASPVEQILFHLAFNTMKAGGHRYGIFLDAAAAAAKLALFQIYQELGGNVRQTGLLCHVESKRVRAIVKAIEEEIATGKSLRSIQSRASYYLIALPHLWQTKFPYKSGEIQLKDRGFSPREITSIKAQLPTADYTTAQIIDEANFYDLLQILHELSQEALPEDQRLPFSDALLKHITFQLLHSKTVIRINLSSLPIPLFALARQSYSPQGIEERALTMIEDVASYFEILQAWTRQENGVMRAIETLDVAPDQWDTALEELDTLLKAWADKYHQEGGKPMVLQAAIGPRRDP